MSASDGSVLGMGINIALRDFFTGPSKKVKGSSKDMRENLVKDAWMVNSAWHEVRRMGYLMIGAGTAGLGTLVLIGKKALESSSELEVFHKQFAVMLHGGTAAANQLYDTLKRFAAETPFTIPQIMTGAKTLLAFGMSADKVRDSLKALGDLSSGTGRSFEWIATVIGRVQSGAFGRAMNALRSMGIDPMQLRDAKGQAVIDAKGHTRKDLSPSQLVDSIMRLAESKFPNMMQTMMGTLPGQLSNFKDKLILMGAAIGDRFKPAVFEFVKSINDLLDPNKILNFATAIGDGFMFLWKIVHFFLDAILKVFKVFMDLSSAHPIIVKLAVVMFALGSAGLIAAGAMVVLAATIRILALTQTIQVAQKLWSILTLIPGPILLIGFAVAALYAAWASNFGGMRDTIMGFFNAAKMIFGGVYELLTSITDGTGHMSMQTYEALQKSGLLKWVVMLFMLLYRVYQVGAGVWEGLKEGFTAVGFVIGPVISLAVWLGEQILKVLGYFGILADKLGTNKWKDFGIVLGWVLAGLLAYKTATAGLSLAIKAATLVQNLWGKSSILFNLWAGIAKVATYAWTAAQWALNVAMDANPIGFIIALIVLLVAAVVILIVKWKAFRDLWTDMPEWAQTLLGAIMPVFWALMKIADYWDVIKAGAMLVKEVWIFVWDAMETALVKSITVMWNTIVNFVNKLRPILPVLALASGLPLDAVPVLKSVNFTEMKGRFEAAAGTDRKKEDEDKKKLVDVLTNLAIAVHTLNQTAVDQKANPPKVEGDVHLDGHKVGKVISKHAKEHHAAGKG